MKIGLYSPYLDTLGGGERYLLSIVSYYLDCGFPVDIFWPAESILKKIKDRFALDLPADRISIVPQGHKLFEQKGNLSAKKTYFKQYDKVFNMSDGSLPLMFGKKNYLLMQAPFLSNPDSWLKTKLKLSKIAKVVCYSNFVKKHIDKTFSCRSTVIYPPVDINRFLPGKKDKKILSVGRFDENLNAKRQDVLIKTFKQMIDNGLKGWELVLAGGLLKKTKDYQDLQRLAQGYPVQLRPNLSFSKLQNLYARSSIYWQATGFGSNLEQNPEKAEHFGITVVEAMVSGCVPLCFNAGGFKEILSEGKDGYLWSSTKELVEKTLNLIKGRLDQKHIVKRARQKSKQFSIEIFHKKLQEL
jgi:glycosyltransferase involved in cell wall biosynthesis